MHPTEQAQSQTPRMSQEQPPKQMQMQPAMEMSASSFSPVSQESHAHEIQTSSARLPHQLSPGNKTPCASAEEAPVR